MDKLHDKNQGGYKSISRGVLRPPLPNDNWPYQSRPSEGNDPQYGIKGPKFERHIYIRNDDVFFDIDSQLAIIAKSRRKEDGTEDDTFSQATTSFRSMFVRWIGNYIGKAKTIMAAFVLEEFNNTAMNNIKDKEEECINLLVPAWYDDTTFNQLSDAVHNYVVNGALREYLVLSLTSKDPVTIDKNALMMENESEIRKLANFSKPGSIKKPMNPF